ncbi:uncharacterized protein LOC111694182 [Trichogramma pretiosum]|uniref:uncharacterized protein LOC111694182 n=1 Tax=Trichogramma pretiosum TaxID=7493 RepID=UPI000C71ADEC|nr:uncharacterized protein LOC111694182 [Trichogramma pretiosum]
MIADTPNLIEDIQQIDNMSKHKNKLNNNKRPLQGDPQSDSKRRNKGDDLTNNEKGQNEKIANNQGYSQDMDNTKPQIFYRENIPGPYSVQVRSLIPNAEVSQFKIGSLVYKLYPSIQEIYRRGRSRVEIIFLNREQANDLANNKSLRNYNLEAYVPGFRKSRKGIIRGIDVDFSEDEILEGVKGLNTINILDVRRLISKVKNETDKEKKWVPTRSVVLSFEGQNLPGYIYIWGVRAKVEPYVQNVMQCYNCLKFGHITKTCRGKSVCFNCGELQHPNLPCQTTTPRCANCKADDSLSPDEINHVSISSKCPKMIEQKKINIQMAYENLSFVEARALVVPKKNTSSNANTVMKTKENFPTLDNAKSRIPRMSNQSNRTNIHKPSYSNIYNQAETYKDVAEINEMDVSNITFPMDNSNLSQDSLSILSEVSSNKPPKKDNLRLMATTKKLSDRIKNGSIRES